MLSSLRVRLVLLILLVVLPLAILLGASAFELRQRARLEASSTTLNLARAAVREYEALVQGARQLLPALAATGEVLRQDGAACSEEFARLLAQYPFYANLGAADADGLIFCSARPFTPPVDVSDRLYFRHAMESGGFAVGEFQIGRITGIPTVNFGYPAVAPDGRTIAVLFAALDLQWVNDMAAAADLPYGATLTIFDKNGTILARYPDPTTWVGRTDPEADILEATLAGRPETTIEARGFDGGEKVYGILPLEAGPAPGVFLSVGIPTEQVYAPVVAIERAQLFGLVLLTALVVATTWALGERMIVQRVEALTRAARRLGEGALETRTGILEGEDELARLARDFDQMAAKLQSREAALQRVTRELQRSNRALRLISECNGVLIRATDEQYLMTKICQTIAAAGGFPLVWVAFEDAGGAKPLRVGAAAGSRTEYLESLLGEAAEQAILQGPAARTIRDGRQVIIQDVRQDTEAPAWREKAALFGFGSCAAFPLTGPAGERGALVLFAEAVSAFDETEIRLLRELADDLSYGIHALRRDAERRRAQEELLRLEEFHRGIVDNITEGIVLIGSDGRFAFANQAAERMLGFGSGELVGRHWKSIVAPADQPTALERLAARRPDEIDRYDITFVRKDGQEIRARVSVRSVVESGELAGALCVFTDVTAERAIQRRVELQDRLAAVGQLAAGIAHDFNNIVGAVILYGEMLLAEEPLSEQARERIRTIIAQAHRAADLTQQILDFGRKSIVERRPLDLMRFVREFERMMARTLPETIRLRVEGEGSHSVNADPGRLQQLLMNLTLNARDACRDGGEIIIGLEAIDVAEGSPPYRDMAPGPWIVMTVRDSGAGIPPDVLPHIFEPFFTTKAAGEGTGLGLSQVYGIVKQHDGYIDVRSEPGKGTTFLVYLPAVSASALETARDAPPVQWRGRGQTILVVEDDEAARLALVDTLRHLNYEVLMAEDGEKAIEVFRQAGGRIALVMSDVVMPKLGGLGLFRELRKIQPDIRALLVTGYPLGSDIRELLEAGRAAWIEKPFDSQTLGQRVAQLLSG